MTEGVVGVERKRLIAGLDRIGGGFGVAEVTLYRDPGSVDQRPGGQVAGRSAAGIFGLGAPQRGLQGRDDRLGDFVVDMPGRAPISMSRSANSMGGCRSWP